MLSAVFMPVSLRVPGIDTQLASSLFVFIAHAPRRDALASLSSVLATSPARGFWPLALRSSFAGD